MVQRISDAKKHGEEDKQSKIESVANDYFESNSERTHSFPNE